MNLLSGLLDDSQKAQLLATFGVSADEIEASSDDVSDYEDFSDETLIANDNGDYEDPYDNALKNHAVNKFLKGHEDVEFD